MEKIWDSHFSFPVPGNTLLPLKALMCRLTIALLHLLSVKPARLIGPLDVCNSQGAVFFGL